MVIFIRVTLQRHQPSGQVKETQMKITDNRDTLQTVVRTTVNKQPAAITA